MRWEVKKESIEFRKSNGEERRRAHRVMARKPSPCRMECREHCAQQRHWVQGLPMMLGGTRSRRSFSEQGRSLVQETRRVSASSGSEAEERTERRYMKWERNEQLASMASGKKQDSPLFSLPNPCAYIHQGRKTTELIFQVIISWRIKRSTNNNCTGNPGIETVPGKPKQVAMFKRQFKLHLLPPGSIP